MLPRLGYRKRVGWLRLVFDPSMMNRLHFGADREHRIPRWVSISWGTRWSDPVWLIELELPDSVLGCDRHAG